MAALPAPRLGDSSTIPRLASSTNDSRTGVGLTPYSLVKCRTTSRWPERNRPWKTPAKILQRPAGGSYLRDSACFVKDGGFGRADELAKPPARSRLLRPGIVTWRLPECRASCTSDISVLNQIRGQADMIENRSGSRGSDPHSFAPERDQPEPGPLSTPEGEGACRAEGTGGTGPARWTRSGSRLARTGRAWSVYSRSSRLVTKPSPSRSALGNSSKGARRIGRGRRPGALHAPQEHVGQQSVLEQRGLVRGLAPAGGQELGRPRPARVLLAALARSAAPRDR